MLGTWDRDHLKVFDMQKAKVILTVIGVKTADAGIMEDLERTMDTIMEGGQLVRNRAWLWSTWGTPVLVLGDSLIPCWRGLAEGEDLNEIIRSVREAETTPCSLAACPDRLLAWTA